jgi:hypothetical protein
MTNFTKTLIAGLILSLGTAATAQAADDTFSVTLKQDKTVSVEENYTSLQKQARAACAEETQRAGFRKTEPSSYLKRKCEKEILSQIIDASNDPELTFVHNETWGLRLKARAYAQK